MGMKTRLLGKTPDELKEIALAAGLPGFAGKQLARWLYVRKVRSISEMTDISKAGREALSRDYEVGVTEPSGWQLSSDGTRKYLFPVGEGEAVEAVMIPDEDRKTLCISSQAGCKMGCHFCMTGRQGFHGQLTAADILSQLIAVEESDELTNAVFMGMGEPLDNWPEVSRAIGVMTAEWGFAWSPKRITLSTIGVIPNLRNRVSFEYTMFEGFNDSFRHADELARLLRGLECRVNLIRFHQIPDFPYRTASRQAMEAFRDRLSGRGVTATIRASRGEDILAACGMLAGQHKQEHHEQLHNGSDIAFFVDLISEH